MASYRKVVFANNQIYHVFNRGIENRSVFTDKREFRRSIETLKYYRFANLPIKLSKFLVLPAEDRLKFALEVNKHEKLVEIIAFCLMPNHFHLLVRQSLDSGVPRFTSNFTNSYTKYFNTKHERLGPLFQGIFKAVLVETNEQLIHLSRYIHLNPVSSFLIKREELESYEWSSLPEYLNEISNPISQSQEVLAFFSSLRQYKNFLLDQISYAQELEKIKHLSCE